MTYLSSSSTIVTYDLPCVDFQDCHNCPYSSALTLSLPAPSDSVPPKKASLALARRKTETIITSEFRRHWSMAGRRSEAIRACRAPPDMAVWTDIRQDEGWCVDYKPPAVGKEPATYMPTSYPFTARDLDFETTIQHRAKLWTRYNNTTIRCDRFRIQCQNSLVSS